MNLRTTWKQILFQYEVVSLPIRLPPIPKRQTGIRTLKTKGATEILAFQTQRNSFCQSQRERNRPRAPRLLGVAGRVATFPPPELNHLIRELESASMACQRCGWHRCWPPGCKRVSYPHRLNFGHCQPLPRPSWAHDAIQLEKATFRSEERDQFCRFRLLEALSVAL